MAITAVGRGAGGPRTLTIVLTTAFVAALCAATAFYRVDMIAVPDGGTAAGTGILFQIAAFAGVTTALASALVWVTVYFGFLLGNVTRSSFVRAFAITFFVSFVLCGGVRFVLVSENLFEREARAASLVQSWADESLERNSRASAALGTRLNALGISPEMFTTIRTAQDVDRNLANLDQGAEILRDYTASRANAFRADRTRLQALHVPAAVERRALTLFDATFAGTDSRWHQKMELEATLLEKMRAFLNILKTNPRGWVFQGGHIAATNLQTLHQLQIAQQDLRQAWLNYADLSLPNRWMESTPTGSGPPRRR